jgi:hypothetical protein
MRFSVSTSSTVGASLLFRDLFSQLSSVGPQWTAYFCFTGLAGLLTLAIWNEKYDGAVILNPLSPADSQNELPTVSNPVQQS